MHHLEIRLSMQKRPHPVNAPLRSNGLIPPYLVHLGLRQVAAVSKARIRLQQEVPSCNLSKLYVVTMVSDIGD